MTDPAAILAAQQTPRWGPHRPPPRLISGDPLYPPQEQPMPDDYAIASQAAQTVIAEEIKDYCPPLLRGSITPGMTQKFADAVARAVVDALAAAHAKS